jgi:hypothetical protein
VGNEPFFSAYSGSYLNSTLLALSNVVNALAKAGYNRVGSTLQNYVRDVNGVYNYKTLCIT